MHRRHELTNAQWTKIQILEFGREGDPGVPSLTIGLLNAAYDSDVIRESIRQNKDNACARGVISPRRTPKGLFARRSCEMTTNK